MKIEGGRPVLDVVRRLVEVGIPVMGHIGLRPQNIHQLGSFRLQRDEEQLLADAQAAQQAGAFSMGLMMPSTRTFFFGSVALGISKKRLWSGRFSRTSGWACAWHP